MGLRGFYQAAKDILRTKKFKILVKTRGARE